MLTLNWTDKSMNQKVNGPRGENEISDLTEIISVEFKALSALIVRFSSLKNANYNNSIGSLNPVIILLHKRLITQLYQLKFFIYDAIIRPVNYFTGHLECNFGKSKTQGEHFLIWQKLLKLKTVSKNDKFVMDF